MSNISQRYSRLIMSPESGSTVWFISVIKTAFCEHKAIFVSNYNIFQWVWSGGACAAPLHAGWWRAALLGPVQLAGQHAPRDSVGRIWIYARLMTNSKTNQTNEVDVERVEMDICLSVCRSSVTKEGGAERILQFVSTFNNSRLSSHLQKLSGGDRLDYARRYLHDFLLLSLKIKSKEELKVQILSVIFQ